MLVITTTGNKCNLINDTTNEILLTWKAGDLARDIFNELTDARLCAKIPIEKYCEKTRHEDLTYDIRYGWIWYRDKDNGNREMRRLSGDEYIDRVTNIARKRQADSYNKDTLYTLLSACPMTTAHELITMCADMRSDLICADMSWYDFSNNSLLYDDIYDENNNSVTECYRNYNTTDKCVSVKRIVDIIAYDFHYCSKYRLCQYCQRMYIPGDNNDRYCSKLCRTEGCRNRNVPAAATAKVTASIKRKMDTIRDIGDQKKLNHYYQALGEWQILTQGAEESIAYRDYSSEYYLDKPITSQSYDAYIRQLFNRLLRWAMSRREIEKTADNILGNICP